MKYLISKADVLETYAELYDTFEDNRFIRKELNKVYDKLNGLPYAQPEPCEDAVSRKDVETEIANLLKRVFVEYEDIAKKATAKLPSVTPKTEQRWISCSERLPEEYGKYLVTKHTFGWNREEYVSNDIAYFDNDGFHKADTVIAWMPLPEPYKAERRTDEGD